MKYSTGSFWAAVMLCVGLAGCGGGGSGASGSGVAATPGTVSVNGKAATADASGQYAIKPGDTAQITANQASDWTSSNGTSGAITLRNPTVSTTGWSATLVNSTSSATLYTVTGKATANASLAQTVIFKVAAGDTRNGSYKVFAANGTQQTLALNLDVKTYDMTDPANVTTSGSFMADAAEAGTYVFASNRITGAYNTARFRLTTDAVVGAFPFAVAFGAPSVYAVQPFIAARSFVTTQALLDGNYNRLSADATPSQRNSDIVTFKLANRGTTMALCGSNIPSPISACPAGSLSNYTVVQGQGANSDRWEGSETANPGSMNKQIFYVARIGGDKVVLDATTKTAPYSAVTLRIGLPSSASVWPVIAGKGPSTLGAWNASGLSATRYTQTGKGPGGAITNLAGTTSDYVGLDGIRTITSATSDRYFTTHSARLNVVLGARNNVNTQGIMQISLIDDDASTPPTPTPGATAGTPVTVTLAPTYTTVGTSISNISPASINTQVAVGATMPGVTITGFASGDLSQLNGATLYVYVVDPAGLFQANPRVAQFGGANPSVQATLAGQQLKTAGTFTGTLQIYACLDSTCSRRLGNVPYPIPYSVVVR